MQVLLLCSDGVWEFISPLEAVKLCSRHPPDKARRVARVALMGREARESATDLAKEAWDRWIREEGGHVVDDITVVLQFLTADVRGPTIVNSK